MIRRVLLSLNGCNMRLHTAEHLLIKEYNSNKLLDQKNYPNEEAINFLLT